MNYYNDNDPRSAAWLRELIKQKVIPAGDVDERSIKDVTGSDLKGYIQCHFFAGIGGWSEALRLAGWPTTHPVWSGSCPCQPFSCAGQRKGEKDARHLWPEFQRLIAECRPPIVFGEQVASKDGRVWLAGVRSDLEILGYAVGAADLCAAGVGAPHIRQRLYWVGDSNGQRLQGFIFGGYGSDQWTFGETGLVGGMADAKHNGHNRPRWHETKPRGNGMVDPETTKRRRMYKEYSRGWIEEVGGSSGTFGFWSNSIWITCRDEKVRRIEPGIFPLVDGLPGRVGILRGAGNAIVPQVAAEFVKAFMDIKFGG
jgi:DNA (cytosine-5)-methyltransferase 1